jgi:polyribonucleotide nucleotidyltransferase
LVSIFAADSASMQAALEKIGGVAAEPEVGKIYRGKITSVKEFGAFVEILPGQEGLLHISELADYRVDKVTDICKEGEFVSVKVLGIDERGRIRLSRKAALKEIG